MVRPGAALTASRSRAARLDLVRALAVTLLTIGALAEAASAQEPHAVLQPWSGRRLAAIDIEGHEHTKEWLIRRELRTEVGRPFDVQTLADDLGRLDDLSIFAETKVSAEAAGDDAVRLRLALKEMPAWLPLLAVNYTEENGFSGGPALSALNLTGRAIKVQARALFGGTTQYSAKVSWPWITGNHVSLDLFGAHLNRRDKLRNFHEESDELTPRVGTYLGDHGRLGGMASLFRMRSDTAGVTLTPDDDDTLLRVGAWLGYDNRDSWRNPRSGWQSELELWHTGGDGSSWALNADVRRYLPTAKRQKLLLSSLLSLQSGTVGADVPSYFTHYIGGANSVRGYAIDQLGTPFSGKNQWLGTAEYAFNIVPLGRWDVWKWSLRLGVDWTLFADAGIAWNEPREFTWTRARGGFGGGIRILIPYLEMVRLDVGWSPEGGLHFHLAANTKPAAQRLRLR